MVRAVSCFRFNCFEGCSKTCCDGWEKHSVAKKQNKKATKSEEYILAEEENVIEDVYERDGSTEEDNGNPLPI